MADLTHVSRFGCGVHWVAEGAGQPVRVGSHLLQLRRVVRLHSIRSSLSAQCEFLSRYVTKRNELVLCREKIQNRRTKVRSFYFDMNWLANYWGCDAEPRR